MTPNDEGPEDEKRREEDELVRLREPVTGDDDLADAHDLPNELSGDVLGGGLGNADGGEPATDS